MALARLATAMVVCLILVGMVFVECSAQVPTRYPTTKRPTTSPFQCADNCPFGFLTNLRCDPDCNVPSCKYDRGECPHAPCSVLPWLDCLNSTHDAYLPLRTEFFNNTRNGSTFFCNDTVAYYRSIANCTEAYKCWHMFDRYLVAEGSAYDFLFCETQKNADMDILEGFCNGQETCDTLLPGAPTSGPTVATLAPTEDLGPLTKTDIVVGIALGSLVGLVTTVGLAFLFWCFCTAAGLVFRITRKEKQLIRLEKRIRDLEVKNVNDVRTVWSNPALRAVELERMQDYKVKLDDELMTLRTLKYGEQVALEMAVRHDQNSTALSTPSNAAVIPVGTRVEPLTTFGVVVEEHHNLGDVPLATVIVNETHA